MRRAVAAALLIVVALVVALYFVLSDPALEPVAEAPAEVEAETPPDGEPRHRPLRALVRREERPRSDRESSPPPVEEDAPVPGSDEPAPPKPVQVRVRVSYSDGSFAPDAAVRATQMHGMVAGQGLGDAGRTDANGIATITMPPSHRFVAYTTLGEYVGISVAESTFNLSEGELVEVVLDRALHVTGTVRSTEGGPVTRGQIELTVLSDRMFSHSWIETPDESGTFRFPPIPHSLFVAFEDPEEAVHTVAVRAPGFTPSQLSVSAEEIERGPLQLELVPGVRVSGRILLPNGSPASGAQVFAPDWTSVETDVDGRYEFDGLGRKGGVLRVRPQPPYASTMGPELPTIAGEHTLSDVFLREGRTLRVRIVDVAGQPLEGVSVSANDPEVEFAARTVTTDADGRAELPGLAERAHELHLDQPSEESWAAGREMTVPEVHPLVDVQQFVLQGQRTVHLVFLDAVDRSPITVSSVDVDAKPVDGSGGAGWGWEGGSIQSVRIQVGTAGLYDVSVELPGYEKETAEGLMVPENGELRIEVLLRKRQ